MKTILTFAFLAAAMFTFAQTDIIEMRSRGRSLEKYERSDSYRMSRMSGDHVTSNFGLLPELKSIEPIEISMVHLDSVRALSDSTTVVYSSSYSRRITTSLEYDLILKDSKRVTDRFPQKSGAEPNLRKTWTFRTDTVLRHPVFSKRHSLDSIKEVIDRDLYYEHPSDSTKFIGFDNEAGTSNEDSVKQVNHERKQKNNGFGWELLFMIVTPVAFLLGMSRLRLASVSED